MKITYSIDTTFGIVTLSYVDNPNFVEWANTMRAVFRDPSYEPGFSFILDRRQVTTAPEKDYIEKVVAFTKAHPRELGKCLTAVVVAGLASYGMARMSQAFLGDTEHTRIFRDIEEARQWLCAHGPKKEG